MASDRERFIDKHRALFWYTPANEEIKAAVTQIALDGVM